MVPATLRHPLYDRAVEHEHDPRPMWRLLLVIGSVLFLILYDEPFFEYVFRDSAHPDTYAQLATLITDVGLAALLTRGRWRTFAPYLLAIAALDGLAFIGALDETAINLGLSLLWIPLLYLMTRRLLGEHDGDAQLLTPIFVGATLVYVVCALWGADNVFHDVQTEFFTESSALIPVLVVGLILERGLRIDNLHATEQRALIAYTLAVVVLGEAAALTALIPEHDTIAGTWGQFTLLVLTVNGLGVALATIVVIGAGAHPEWERARTPRSDP
jgi:hypothetical protein